jgi:N-methylhydantoinase A
VGAARIELELVAEARLSRQVWQIDVPLRRNRFAGDQEAVEELRRDFQRLHEEIFAVRDDYSEVDVVALRARVRCPSARSAELHFTTTEPRAAIGAERDAYFRGYGRLAARVCALHEMDRDHPVAGPAIVESPFSTIVVDPGSTATRGASGSLVITLAQPDRQEGSAHAGAVSD